jgi:hypothetical protein
MEHYNGHVEEFGVKGMGPAEYQERADMFLGPQKPQGVLECVRRGGDKVRFNPNKSQYKRVWDSVEGRIYKDLLQAGTFDTRTPNEHGLFQLGM